MHVCAFIAVYGHVSAGFCGGQLSAFHSMELKLQVVVCNLTDMVAGCQTLELWRYSTLRYSEV